MRKLKNVLFWLCWSGACIDIILANGAAHNNITRPCAKYFLFSGTCFILGMFVNRKSD